MRKKFVQIAALMLVFCLIPLNLAHAEGEEGQEEPIIRVGLYYGSNALPGANLLNSEGSGYRFGYMDGDTFVQLGSTEETAISMVKTLNVYYSSSLPGGGYGYSDQITSDIGVGCYHLELPGSYPDFESAQSAASAVPGGYVAWIEGAYYVRVGAYLNSSSVKAAQESLGVEGTQIKGTTEYGISVVETGTDRVLFQFDGGKSNAMLVVKPGLDDSVKTVTHFKGQKYYGSFRYERVGGGDMTVVNLVPLEDYVRGVIPYEMSNSFPLEALKAQAVCARSYVMTNLNHHSSYHFDVCNTTECQVYYGTASANETTDRAVDETLGQFAWYDGKICQTFFHSCDGGATENSENVWTTAFPYLQGVFDPYEALVESKISNYHWTITYTPAELKQRLNSRGYQCGDIVDFYVSKTTSMGNMYSVVIIDTDGTKWTISRDTARIVLGTRSLRFTITGGSGEGDSASDSSNSYAVTNGTLDSLNGAWVIDGDGKLTQMDGEGVYAITGSGVETVEGSSSSAGTSQPSGNPGEFVITGTGNGHNVGMSQWGAYAMAQQGYTYQDILKFYFTGVEIHT